MPAGHGALTSFKIIMAAHVHHRAAILVSRMSYRSVMPHRADDNSQNQELAMFGQRCDCTVRTVNL